MYEFKLHDKKKKKHAIYCVLQNPKHKHYLQCSAEKLCQRHSVLELQLNSPRWDCVAWASHKYQHFYNLNYTDIFLFSSTGQLPLRPSRLPWRCQALHPQQQQQHSAGRDLELCKYILRWLSRARSGRGGGVERRSGG